MTEFSAAGALPPDSDVELAGLLSREFPSDAADGNIDEAFMAKAMAAYRDESRPYFLGRIDDLRVEHHRGVSLKQIMYKLSRIIDKATAAGFDDVVAKANLQLTKVRRHTGEFRAARMSALKALELTERIGDLRTQALAHFELGMVLGSGPEAKEHLTKALDTSMELGDRDLIEAKAWYGRGRARKKEGDLFDAISFIDRAVSLYRQVGDDYGYARALSRLGYYQRLAGQFDDATKTLTEARDYAVSGGFKRVEGYAHLELGHIAHSRGRNDDAHAALHAAHAIFEEICDPLGEAHSLIALSVFERSQSRLGAATEHAMGAYRRYKEWDLRENNHTSAATAFALRCLGECLRDARRFTEAEQMLAEALMAYRALGYHDCQALTMAAQAKLMAARGDGKPALGPALDAIDMIAQLRGSSRQGTDSNDLTTPHMSCYLVAAEIANECNDDQALFIALSGAYQELVLRCIRRSATGHGAASRQEMLQLQFVERGISASANEPNLAIGPLDPGMDQQRRALLDEVARREPLLAALRDQPLATAIVVPVDHQCGLAVWLDADGDPRFRGVTLEDLPPPISADQ